MASYNRVTLVGNLGADPELKFTPSNRPVANMSLATTEAWKGKDGQKQERTDWHRIVVWGPQAENCAKFLAKGRTCLVEGRLQNRSYEDKNGKKKYTTEVVADRVVFLGSGEGKGAGQHHEEHAGNGRSGGRPGWGEAPPASGANDDNPPLAGDDDIPF